MAAKSAIERGISTIWQKILTVVNNALVYLDSRTAEWIHWCGSLQDFIDAGALNVCDISSARVSTVPRRNSFFNILAKQSLNTRYINESSFNLIGLNVHILTEIVEG